ncbi:MAG TPA: ABC transporter ATP-binding protein [Gammaproteobacteria bacterium]|nr:ABC transporter ATP-binding protein [Gammaproteobacteria bacterium]
MRWTRRTGRPPVPLLEIKNLNTRFQIRDGEVSAVNDVSLTMEKGETLGIVGESGSGKSQLVLSIMGLLASNGQATGSVHFNEQELLGLSLSEMNKVRGNHIAMIFQDPMTCLNGYLTIARQMTEVLTLHKGMSYREAKKRSIEMLDAVHIPDASNRINRYPHEFSGGMRQRVMIAMALLCEPDLLIADEPTTALDVTVQAQIIDLMNELKADMGMSIIMITHDLGVIAGISDNVAVMYAGRVCEYAPVRAIFNDPQHPYTLGLLQSVPRLDAVEATALHAIPGNPPNLQHLPAGCSYQDRCEFMRDICVSDRPELHRISDGRSKACHLEVL